MTFPVTPSKCALAVTHTGGANAGFYIKLSNDGRFGTKCLFPWRNELELSSAFSEGNVSCLTWEVRTFLWSNT